MVPFKYSNQPLSAVGSIRSIGGRFNFGENLRPSAPFHALYLAEDADTAFREYFGMQSDERRAHGKLSPFDLALAPKKSFACINVSGSVTNLLDITQVKSLQKFCDVIGKFTIDPKSRELIRQTHRQPLQIVRDPEMLMKTMMAQNWRELGAQLELPSNSQIFGQIAFHAGYDGVLFDSTRGNGRCLCLFVENLTYSETNVKLADEAPTGDIITELNSDTWSKLVTPFSLLKAAGRLIRAHLQ
jgi:hypothetical protein